MSDLMGLRNRKFHEILAQQAASPEPTPSWGAAIARALQGGIAGLIERGDEAQQRDALVEAIKIARGGQTPQPSPLGQVLGGSSAPAQSPPLAAALAGQKRPVQIIEGNAETQPSPLDPPAGRDRDLAIRTMYGEDPGQSALGVANVIRRRAIDGNYGGSTPSDVVMAKGQFEPWARPEAKARMMALQPGSPEYERLGGVLDQAYAGNDPTGGATHFFAPKAQAALGRNAPSWARGPSTTIGPHAFYGGGGEAALPPGAQPTQGQLPQPTQMAQAKPGLNDDQFTRIETMARSNNPGVRAMASQALQTAIANSFKPADWDISHRPDGAIVAANKQNPNDIRIIQPPGRSQALIEHKAGETAAETAAKLRTERETKDAMPASFEDTAKVRGEIRSLPSYKNISEAAPIYKTMLETAGRNSKASDLNLVYGLGKIFDPGSVVREGEMVMVKRTASLPDWLIGSINSLNGGAALTPETRKAILAEAHSRMQSYAQLYDQETGMYRAMATENRMKPEHVIPSFGPFNPWNPQPEVAASGPTRQQAIEELKRRGKM